MNGSTKRSAGYSRSWCRQPSSDAIAAANRQRSLHRTWRIEIHPLQPFLQSFYSETIEHQATKPLIGVVNRREHHLALQSCSRIPPPCISDLVVFIGDCPTDHLPLTSAGLLSIGKNHRRTHPSPFSSTMLTAHITIDPLFSLPEFVPSTQSFTGLFIGSIAR
ncbi:hypothetical protein L2E82_21969 [Cichorium intybus]|uniref:Uncharacterized protein n=1 Tax=Cichorium intybus TaxID=13427 RepID=A0ACB9DXE0_CICIN|nr:hypothetical protein L2E82_21969 [Cichorium intybus]